MYAVLNTFDLLLVKNYKYIMSPNYIRFISVSVLSAIHIKLQQLHRSLNV